jgi:hypothetical protein
MKTWLIPTLIALASPAAAYTWATPGNHAVQGYIQLSAPSGLPPVTCFLSSDAYVSPRGVARLVGPGLVACPGLTIPHGQSWRMQVTGATTAVVYGANWFYTGGVSCSGTLGVVVGASGMLTLSGATLKRGCGLAGSTSSVTPLSIVP